MQVGEKGAGSRKLTLARTTFWAFIWITAIVLLAFRFYSPSAHSFEHTYQTSVPPGTLSTERWGWDFFSEGLYVLAWFIPLTAAFMVDAPTSKGRRVFHLIVLVLLFIWFSVQLVWTSVDWSKANQTGADNFSNPFNDDRWCCIYFALPGAPCVNTAACVPGVGAGDLKPNGVALFRFWFNVLLMIITVVDFALTMAVFNRAVQAFLVEFSQTREPLMEATQIQQQHAYSGRSKRGYRN